MAQPPTPLPQRARAVIVGLESYDPAPDGQAGDALAAVVDALQRITPLPGLVEDAFRLAASLQKDLGLAAADIDMWLNPAPAKAPADGPRCHAFTRDRFERFLSTTLADDAAGGLLLMFWSGHGVIDSDNRLRLLLPESTVLKPRDFEAENICTLLAGGDHGAFSHQLLVFNACRVNALTAGIEGRLNNTMLPVTTPSAARPVLQLRVFGCALAESSQQPEDGALLLRALREGWARAGRNPWPDFEDVAGRAATRIAEQTDLEQRPQVLGWSGALLFDQQPTLPQLLGLLPWKLPELQALAQHCVRRGDRRLPMADRAAIVSVLSDLLPQEGIEPLSEFVARVLHKAGAAAPAKLADWYQRDTNEQQRTDITARLDKERAWTVLQLCVQDQPPAVSAALMDLEGRSLLPNWDIHTGLAFDAEDPTHASLIKALGAWLEQALACVDGQQLLLELFLPDGLLGEQLDDCKLAAKGDHYKLGVELPTLLRALDRHKSPKKRDAWSTKSRQILGRYGGAAALLHWSPEPADADAIRSAFAEGLGQGAVWLGLQQPPAAGAAAEAFDCALASGVPSILWLRKPAQAPARAVLEATLVALLQSTALNVSLGLRAWRQQHAKALGAEPALLLDDPARPPPWTQAYGRAGGASALPPPARAGD